MEKFKIQTLDGVQNNIEKVAGLFQNCITYNVDKNGNLVQTI